MIEIVCFIHSDNIRISRVTISKSTAPGHCEREGKPEEHPLQYIIAKLYTTSL